MGVDTSAVAWFGFPGQDLEDAALIDQDWIDNEGDDDCEVTFVGWYDSQIVALALPGTVIYSRNWTGTPFAPKLVIEGLPEKIAALKASAARAGFTFTEEPAWYFAARQS